MSARSLLRRRAAAGALAVSVIAAMVSFVATPASAATVDVSYLCVTSYAGSSFDHGVSTKSVTLSAPTTVNPGENVTLTFDFAQLPMGMPFGIADADVFASATVIAQPESGGAASSISGVSGLLEADYTVAPNELYDASYSMVVPTTGLAVGDRLELTPDVFTVTLSGATSVANPPYSTAEPLATMTTTCTPQEVPAYAARTTIYGPPDPSPDDACVAQEPGDPAPAGCDTEQNTETTIVSGALTQRAYVNSTPTSGSVSGVTSNVNSTATQINLGTIESPLAPTPVVGHLNDITVTDGRGGSFGWSLTADLSNITGTTFSNLISKSALAISPTCVPATAANAWDYNAPGPLAIPGFDPIYVAPGAAAGTGGQNFSGTVELCTKDLAQGPLTDSTGGIWTVSAPVTLTVPSFQAADTYTATMTITLI